MINAAVFRKSSPYVKLQADYVRQLLPVALHQGLTAGTL